MSGVYWGLAGSVGTQGHQGCRCHKGAPRVGVLGHQGCRVSGMHWSGRWTGSLTTLGPSPGSQHSHWFALGSDLPHQGQARAPFEGPITPTGFPWGVTYLAKAKQVTEISSAGYYIHLELYFVTVCTFVSMPPHHIFLHAMLRNVIHTIFSADQVIHLLTPSILCIMTQWY